MDLSTNFTTKMSFHMTRSYEDGRRIEVVQDVGSDAEYLGDIFGAFAEFLNSAGFSYLAYEGEQTEEGWLIRFER